MHNNIWEWHHYNGKQNWKTNIKVGDHLMKVLAVGARLGGAVRVAVAVGVAVGVAGVAGFVAGFVAGIVAGVVAGVGGGFVGGIRAYKKVEGTFRAGCPVLSPSRSCAHVNCSAC